MKKLLFILTELTPYNALLFIKLAEIRQNTEIQLYLTDKKMDIHPWQRGAMKLDNCKVYYLDAVNNWLRIVRELLAKHNSFILGGYHHAKLFLILLMAIFLRQKYLFWTDTPDFVKQRGRVRHALKNFLYQRIFASARGILTTGNIAMEIFASMGCPREKLTNLPWTVDTEKMLRLKNHYCKENTTIRKNKIIFLSAGQLIKRKRYDIAVQSFRELVHNHPDHNMIYLIAGCGPDYYHLQRLIFQYSLCNRVFLLGWMQPEDMEIVFSLADILVHPAEWDPYPVVVLEAMAAAMPVLASNRTMAAVDRGIHGVSGFIHEVGDYAQLARQMAYFVENPQALQEMGRAARKQAELWPVARCVQALLDAV